MSLKKLVSSIAAKGNVGAVPDAVTAAIAALDADLTQQAADVTTTTATAATLLTAQQHDAAAGAALTTDATTIAADTATAIAAIQAWVVAPTS